MPLEGFGTPVGVVSTNLTVIVDIQAMKLIQPVRNGFAIPAKGQVLGVVNNLILFIFTFTLADLLLLLLFSFFSGSCLLALYIFMSEMSLFPENLYIFVDLSFKESNIFVPLSISLGAL